MSRKRTGPSAAQRSAVHERAGGRCERCSAAMSWGGGQIHHRKPRKMGGTSRSEINDLSNLLLLCGDCHGWVESNRTEAYAAGWLVREPDDPATTPVRMVAGPVLLAERYRAVR